MGFSIINHPFWVAPFQETSICIHMYVCIYTYVYIYIGVIFIIIHDNYIENSMGGVIYWINIYIYVYIHDNSHKPFTVIGGTSPSSPAPSRSSPPATAAHQGWHLRHRHRHLRAMDLYWGFGGIFSPIYGGIYGGIYVEIDVFWDFGSWWKTKFSRKLMGFHMNRMYLGVKITSKRKSHDKQWSLLWPHPSQCLDWTDPRQVFSKKSPVSAKKAKIFSREHVDEHLILRALK